MFESSSLSPFPSAIRPQAKRTVTLFWGTLWCTLLLVLPTAFNAAAADPVPRTAKAAPKAARNLLGGSSEAFTALARRVANSSDGERAEFARISLEEMGLAFQEEADRAREFRPDPNKRVNAEKDPRKWAVNTLAYADRLLALSESVQSGAIVEVRIEQEGTILIVVDGNNIIISGPNITKPKILEDRIMSRVCLDADCQSLASAEYAGGLTGGYISGHWNFGDSDTPVFATNIGLNFLFDDRVDLAAKERACTQIAAELAAIVQSLKNLLWQHQSVDWSAVAVRDDVNDSTTQLLRVNNGGDFVKLALPQLAKAPYVLQSAMPWVRSRVEGQVTQHYVQLPPGALR